MPTAAVPGSARVALAAVALLLVAQALFIRRLGEPYPAVIMPGFEGAGGYRDGKVHVTRFEAAFVGPDREVVVTPAALFGPINDSMHGTISSTCLLPDDRPPEPRPAPRRWLGRLREHLFPWHAAGAYDRRTEANRASLRDWLRGRAAVLAPDLSVERVEVRWFRDTIDPAAGGRVVAREPDGVLTVPLGG